MNTFDIYLKGGQVITVKTKTSYDETLLNIWDDTDERRILIVFEKSNVSIVKNHISAIKDRTKEKEAYSKLAKAIAEPYKPWSEQK